MRALTIFVCLLATLLATANGQSADGGLSLPDVRIDDANVTFQTGLYPEYYQTHSAARDLRWVHNTDSALVAFWQTNGTIILTTLSQLGGIPWQESTIDMYLVRYYPSVGGSDPLVFPLGGIRRGDLIEAAPEGSRMYLNVIYQMAHRLLNQTVRSNDPAVRSLADHPLMRSGAYRRDNLALLLALVTAQQVIGLDSTYDAYQSAFWTRQLPGRSVFDKYLLSKWILSPDRPLAQWVIEEPQNSELVTMTRAPQQTTTTASAPAPQYIEDLPLKGQLGFSVTTTDLGQLAVDEIDTCRLGYVAGLRQGDVIRTVGGARVRSHKDLIERLVAALDAGGALLEIMRGQTSLSLLLQPRALYHDDESEWEETGAAPISSPGRSPDTADIGEVGPRE